MSSRRRFAPNVNVDRSSRPAVRSSGDNGNNDSANTGTNGNSQPSKSSRSARGGRESRGRGRGRPATGAQNPTRVAFAPVGVAVNGSQSGGPRAAGKRTDVKAEGSTKSDSTDSAVGGDGVVDLRSVAAIASQRGTPSPADLQDASSDSAASWHNNIANPPIVFPLVHENVAHNKAQTDAAPAWTADATEDTDAVRERMRMLGKQTVAEQTEMAVDVHGTGSHVWQLPPDLPVRKPYPKGTPIGKLRVYASGKKVLVIGGVPFEVAPGTNTYFHEKLMVFDGKNAHAHVLSDSIESRYRCSLDVDMMLSERERAHAPQ